jgi:hypothetical protein
MAVVLRKSWASNEKYTLLRLKIGGNKMQVGSLELNLPIEKHLRSIVRHEEMVFEWFWGWLIP